MSIALEYRPTITLGQTYRWIMQPIYNIIALKSFAQMKGMSVVVNCQNPGKICDGLWYLGRPESGVYLLEGRNGSIIISGGMSYLVPDLLHQFDEFGLKEDRIQGIIILHAH